MPDKTALQNDTSNTKPEKEKAKRWLDRWSVRIGLLLIAALGGLLLAKHGGFRLVQLRLINLTIASNRQLAILLMSVPVLFVLWIFRTWDRRELIKKTGQGADAAMISAKAARQNVETARQSAEIARQSAEATKQNVEIARQSVEAAKQSAEMARQSEKTARENVETAQKAFEADTLARNINMLSSDDLRMRCIGLINLAKIKRQGNFVKEIDSATRQNLQLQKANFQGENLSGLNLEGAHLEEANLSGTDLTGSILCHANMHKATLINTALVEADLQWAILTETILTRADFRNAKLQNAALTGATYWEYAKFKDAKFHSYGTRFPSHFGDPKTRGMVLDNNPFSGP